MEFTIDNYMTLILCLIGYAVIGIVSYIHLKIWVISNKRNLESLRRDHEALKQDMNCIVNEIKQIIRDDRSENTLEHDSIISQLTQTLRADRSENRGSHDMITKALGTVAVNVGELKNELIKLIDK